MELLFRLLIKKTKGTACPFRAGFSTDIDAVNNWVNMIHIHATLQVSLQKFLHVSTSSKHKELTDRGKKIHADHVRKLKEKLVSYGVDPFSAEAAKHIPSGKQIAEQVIKDFIRAPEIGKKQVISFINDRLKDGLVSFFTPITKNKLVTGIQKKPKTKKAVEILKEDCQAFETIIAKSYSTEEAFGYPITSYPLSVADLEGSLRQSDKASLRNLLIEEANASLQCVPKNASWIVDGMGAVRALKPQKAYKAWIEGLLKFITPREIAEALSAGMVNDTYPRVSTKNGVRILVARIL